MRRYTTPRSRMFNKRCTVIMELKSTKASRIEGPRLFAQTNRPIPMRLFPTALDLIVGDAKEDEQDAAPLHENESRDQPDRS